jgi:SpoVK/Ycf46/Vps4 family AAA+-type ATPase
VSSPFADYSSRIFVCYGRGVRDLFVPPCGIPLSIGEFLHQHLRAIGYRTILFYSHDGLYFYDRESRDRVIDGDRPPQVTSDDPAPRDSALAPAPGGLSLRRRTGGAPHRQREAPADGVQMCYPDMNRLSEMIPILRRLIRHGGPDVAVIFQSDHLVDFSANGPAVEQFRGFLDQHMRSLRATVRHIVIFLFGLELEQLSEQLERKRALDQLLGHGGDKPVPGIAEPIHVGSPERDEVRRLIHFYRLRHGLEVEWKSLDKVLKRLTASLKTGDFGSVRLQPGGERPRLLSDLDVALKMLLDEGKGLDNEGTLQMTGKRIEQKSALQRLEDMVGLDGLKTHIRGRLKHREHLVPANARPEATSAPDLLRLRGTPGIVNQQGDFLHLFLVGNPGTGKTTVARLIGEIYQEAGLLELGHTIAVGRDGLVGGYVGQTAIKTRERIQAALGGVLFIDEAYSLAHGGENDFGQEAINTLIQAMSDYKDRLCVIFAGYPDDMDRLLASNEGFARRLGARITLEDYTAEQLTNIFEGLCRKARPPATCDRELVEVLPRFFEELYDQRARDFGNAGAVEKLFSDMQEAVIQELDAPAETHVFARRHIPERFKRYLEQIESRKRGGPLEELEALVGLRGVKGWVQRYIDTLAFDRQRGAVQDVKAPAVMHFVFGGNPGTGKTTVARLMARQFKRMGLLKTDRLVELTATELSGQAYMGHAEKVVHQRFAEALGGVLFIDEAHQLAQPYGYGPNVLGALTPLLTRHAGELIVIFAGYHEQMQAIYEIDPGLRRRLQTIVFDDFTAEELVSVFKQSADKDGMRCSPEAEQSLVRLFRWMVEHKTPLFGNAGTAEKVFQRAKDRRAQRAKMAVDQTDLNLLEAKDIPPPEDCGDLL